MKITEFSSLARERRKVPFSHTV